MRKAALAQIFKRGAIFLRHKHDLRYARCQFFRNGQFTLIDQRDIAGQGGIEARRAASLADRIGCRLAEEFSRRRDQHAQTGETMTRGFRRRIAHVINNAHRQIRPEGRALARRAFDADIAADLGCRLGTVRSLASRALAALRRDPELGFSDGGVR